MDFGLAFQVRSASAGIASSIFRNETSSRSYSAISSFCMSIGNLQNFVRDKHNEVPVNSASAPPAESHWTGDWMRCRRLSLSSIEARLLQREVPLGRAVGVVDQHQRG